VSFSKISLLLMNYVAKCSIFVFFTINIKLIYQETRFLNADELHWLNMSDRYSG